MLSNRMAGGGRLHPTRTCVDSALMERSGLDELNLRRARRAFAARWNRIPHAARRSLIEGTICVRFRFVTDLLQEVWSSETWLLWLAYLEHSQREIDEMRRGEYPIYPHMVRLFSALLGIRVDFLLVGSWPTSDAEGTSIDVCLARP